MIGFDFVWDKETLDIAEKQLRLLLVLHENNWYAMSEKDQKRVSLHVLPIHAPVPVGQAGVVTTAWRQMQKLAERKSLFRRNRNNDLVLDAMGILFGLQVRWQMFVHRTEKKPTDRIPLFVGQPDGSKVICIALAEHAPKMSVEVTLDETDLEAAVARIGHQSPEEKAKRLIELREENQEKEKRRKQEKEKRKAFEKKAHGLRKIGVELETRLEDTPTLNGNGSMLPLSGPSPTLDDM